MTLLKSILKLFVLIVFSLTLFSCSNNMTRDKAKDLISKKFNLPFVVTEKLQHGEVNYMKSLGGSNIAAENSLKQQGLINFDYKGDKKDFFFSYASYYLDLTSEGQKYKTGETTDSEGRQLYLVKVAEQVFVDVTGILEINDGKAAQVEYTWKYDNITPFGQAFSLRNQQVNQKDGFLGGRVIYNDGKIYNNKVMIVKYDDGWRIQEER